MEGYNVLFPIGFDAFGLPTENYAIKNHIHPAVVTKKNIENFTKQLKMLGYGFDWDRAVNTTDPDYYKWTQWIFLQMFKKGLAYKATMRASAVRLCVVSNSHKPRVVEFCRKYGLDCVTHAKKPFQRGIRETLSRFSLEPAGCALVGDQIYTDVLGANCGGLTSILIQAINNHTIWLKLRHAAELPFIALGRRRIKHDGPRGGRAADVSVF